MMSIWLELALIVGLVLLNGCFALAELAIVSSRRVRLQQMAEAGGKGAAQALALADNPGRFLSAVQVGITLIGIGSGAFGGATLGARLGPVLDALPPSVPFRSPESIERDTGRAFAASEVVGAVDRLIGFYKSNRRTGERFLDAYRRLGPDPFKEVLYGDASH